MSKPVAIVMGRNYASLLGMIRAAGKAGCDVIVIRSVTALPSQNIKSSVKQFLMGKPIESTSKYVRKYLYCIEPHREELVQLLLKEAQNYTEKIVLLPTDDYTASTIDLYQEKLREKFLFPGIADGEAGAVVELMNKDLQKQIAIEHDLDVAKGWRIEITNGKFQIPEQIEYPCFTKPEISFLGNKRYMKKCNTPEELKHAIKEIAKNGDCPILVEQYVEIEKECCLLGFCDGNNVFIPAIIHQLIIGSGSHKGVTLLGKVIPPHDYAALCEKLKNMMRAIHFVGLFDIDLYENNQIIYFNELNLRLGASGYALICAGVNLPEMFIKMLLNQDYLHDHAEITSSITYLNDKVNLDDYSSGYITWDAYQESIQKADYRFILDPEDTAPFKAYTRLENLKHIKHSLKK